MTVVQQGDRFEVARRALGSVDEVMEQHGYDRLRDGFYRCPFHDEQSGSFHAVKGSESYFKCFGCDAKGDTVDLEAHLSGRTINEVIDEVAPAVREIFSEEITSAAAYLKLRGVTDEGLIARSQAEFHDDRVWLPWIDYDGKTVYSSGRTTTNEKPRYKNSQGVRPPLYPSPGAWQADTVVLVEGQIDALAAEQAGVPAFATGTSVLLEEGIPILLSKKRVTIVADADPAGVRWREDVTAKLQGHVELWEAVLPSGYKDLADVAQQAVEAEEDASEAVAAILGRAQEIRSRFGLWTLDQLAAKPAPEALVHDVLQADSLAVIYGQSGHGKTFVTLDIALSIATGLEWMGFEVRQGPVVYVAAEGMFGIAKRVDAWKHEHHVSDVEHFYVVPTPVNLLSDETEEFANELARMTEPPRLIIFDTFARSMVGGEENSAKDVGRAIGALDDLRAGTGATVLLVHHTAKHNTQERGSSALRGASDTMLKVRMDDGIVITCDKQKEGAPFFPLHAKLVVRGESCALQRTYMGYA